ncbi:MAG: leucyl aminopeptidase [Deltaproteobacteria bacterium]|nr:leucyl aminopeptidase [Deltaproteobacteria bacterium]
MKNLFDQWKISLLTLSKDEVKADVCVIPVWKQQGKLDDWTAVVDKEHQGIISNWIGSSFVKNDREKAFFFPNIGSSKVKDFLVFCLGDPEQSKPEEVRNAFARASKMITQRGYKKAAVVHAGDQLDFSLAIEGFLLGSYRFAKYKDDEKAGQSLDTFSFYVPASTKKTVATALDKISATTRAIFLARDLVNEPGNVIYPASFAKIAKEVCKDRKLTCKVLDLADLKKEKMNLHIAVGQASAHEPKLVHIHYKPAQKAKKKVALVGKGVTFDTGGLSLKPPTAMVSMKSDMSGAASVLGTMMAISDLNLPIEVHGILGLAENAVAGNATRPDDVVRSRSGITVEIENTDAEGRLVLADALSYADDLKVDYIIDVATLTGACVIALGDEIFAVYSQDDALAQSIGASAAEVGDNAWRMPLHESYKAQLKSDFADMRNVGGREGGSITAALFLSEFVKKAKWAHLDIAGPARAKREFDLTAKGGSGIPTRTFIRFLENLQ